MACRATKKGHGNFVLRWRIAWFFIHFIIVKTVCSDPAFFFVCAQNEQIFRKFSSTFHSRIQSLFASIREIVGIEKLYIMNADRLREHRRLINILCAVFSLTVSRSLYIVYCCHFHLFITCSDDSKESDFQRIKSMKLKKVIVHSHPVQRDWKKCKRKVIELFFCEEFHHKFFDCSISFSNGLKRCRIYAFIVSMSCQIMIS